MAWPLILSPHKEFHFDSVYVYIYGSNKLYAPEKACARIYIDLSSIWFSHTQRWWWPQQTRFSCYTAHICPLNRVHLIEFEIEHHLTITSATVKLYAVIFVWQLVRFGTSLLFLTYIKLKTKTHLKYHIARIVHPKILGRMSWLAQLYGQTLFQDQSTSLRCRTVTIAGRHRRRFNAHFHLIFFRFTIFLNHFSFTIGTLTIFTRGRRKDSLAFTESLSANLWPVLLTKTKPLMMGHRRHRRIAVNAATTTTLRLPPLLPLLKVQKRRKKIVLEKMMSTIFALINIFFKVAMNKLARFVTACRHMNIY